MTELGSSGPRLPDLVARARRLTGRQDRVLLGIAGPPGAGKSTLAADLVAALPQLAVLVPMDGFHLANEELDRLGRRQRKGAPDTFDAAGYVHLLRRLREHTEHIVYAPVFVREQEQAVAGALPVPRDARLVVTEGNYLLGDDGFAAVRGLLDECWCVDLDPERRRERLVARHVRYGRTPQEAAAWVDATDEPNARLIQATRDRADLYIDSTTVGRPCAG